MKMNPDDPKWTAYVLGELEEGDRAALELELESSEEAREFVEDLRLTAAIIRERLAAEAAFGLTSEQRATIRASASDRRKPWLSPLPIWAAGLVAASLLLVVALTSSLWHSRLAVPARQEQVAEVTAVRPDVTGDGKSQHPPAAPTAPDGLSAQEARRQAASGTALGAPVERAGAGVVAGGGTISGVVMDSARALIPGATVQALNSETGDVTTTLTSETGAYGFSNLKAGTYQVTATLPGFQTARYTNVAVAQDQAARLNFDLRLGTVAETVEVTATTEAQRSGPGPVGQIRSENRGRDLPVANSAQLAPPAAPAVPGQQGQPVQFSDGNFLGFGQRGSGGVATGAGTADRERSLREGASAGAPNAGTGAGFGEGTGTGGAAKGVVAGVLGGVSAAAATPPPLPPSPPAVSMLIRDGIALDRIVPPQRNNEVYVGITENPFIAVSQQPLATFSADVDTASYANVRRFLTQNQWPPRDAVRIEELINYFSYEYPQAAGPHPITANIEMASAPWNPQHRLVRIGIKAKDVQMGRKPSNLVFLIDVSGSMSPPERLPLLKSGLRMLVNKLTEDDTVSIVVYAGASGVALPPTSGEKKEVILRAMENLQSGGSTNGAAGIRLAYDIAVSNFLRGGINRVILATDGDFNVGITNQNDLLRLIEDKARSGVFLTVLGFGIGNLKDATLELLADKGNGHYAYIDSLNEARKVLVEEMGSTLVTVAKDVKLQVEFNPAQVNAYRLIGYENRVLRAEDFNNDLKDAGDVGAGHTVTALFEVIPRGVEANTPGADPLRYQRQQPLRQPRNAQAANEMLNLKIRYKDPDGTDSKLVEVPVIDRGGSFSNASTDFRFAAAVAGFGMILRDSTYKGSATLDWVRTTAADSRGADRNGYREEFIRLVEHAMQIGPR